MNITQNPGSPGSISLVNPTAITVAKGDKLEFDNGDSFDVQIIGANAYGPASATPSGGGQYTLTPPAFGTPASYSVSYGPITTGTNQIIITPSGGTGGGPGL